MPLKVVYQRDIEGTSLRIGKCASDEPLDEAWRGFALELLSRALGDNALIVILASSSGVDDYGQICAELGIPYERIAQRQSRRGRESITYFARPTAREGIAMLAKELVEDPVWCNSECLFFCRPEDAPVAEELGLADWPTGVSLRCNFADEDLLYCTGRDQDLDSMSALLMELAEETGTELVPASSSDEVTHLMGWETVTFWELLRSMWKGKRRG